MTSATISRSSPNRGAISQAPVYDARPTLRFSGQADGRADELLLDMVMEESDGGLGSLALTFSNWASTVDNDAGLAFPPDGHLRLGSAITVLVGDRQDPRELFGGTITAIEEVYGGGQPPRITALAEDGLQKARLARRSRVFVSQSPADVVRSVAAELGLRVSIDGLGEPIADWTQLDETDLAFLRRLLGRCDADLGIVGQELQVKGRGDAGSEVLTLNMLADLQWLEVGADLADQVSEVTARGWDATEGAAVLGRASSITNPGPGQGEEGSSLLRESFGDRPENLAHLAVGSQVEADALASAAFDRRARSFVKARGCTEGNPQLRQGTALQLGGSGGRFDNTYRVTTTRHLYTKGKGYQTEFEAECAYIGAVS